MNTPLARPARFSKLARPTVVLLSGGLDSAVAGAMAQNRGWDIIAAVSFDYGQRHRLELEAAKAVADVNDWPHEIICLPTLGAGVSALTSDIPVPMDRTAEQMGEGIPVSYVPLRNSVFLTIAAGIIESWVKQYNSENLDQAAVVIGAHEDDSSGYPDCRKKYFVAMERALRLGSSLEESHGVLFRVLAPVIEMTKDQIVAEGRRLGVPIGLTRSCYTNNPEPCGRCDSCQIRERALARV